MENKLTTVSNSLNYLYNVYANYLQTRKIKTNDKDSAVKGNIQQFDRKNISDQLTKYLQVTMLTAKLMSSVQSGC